MAASTGLITTKQFLALPDRPDAGGNRVKQELICGEIVEMPVPSRRHDIAKNEICRVLTLFLEVNPGLGFRAFVELAYAVSGRDTFVPDVSVVQKSRVYHEAGRIVTGAPEIAIEVVSPAETVGHIRAKINAYLRHGSRSVWIVYPEETLIEIHTTQGVREIKGDQTLEDESLPGFSETAAKLRQGL
jgi:Uma2 family endonuclease